MANKYLEKIASRGPDILIPERPSNNRLIVPALTTAALTGAFHYHTKHHWVKDEKTGRLRRPTKEEKALMAKDKLDRNLKENG